MLNKKWKTIDILEIRRGSCSKDVMGYNEICFWLQCWHIMVSAINGDGILLFLFFGEKIFAHQHEYFFVGEGEFLVFPIITGWKTLV